MFGIPLFAFAAIAAIFLFLFIGIVFSRLYKRSNKGKAFVRTGLGGLKVVSDGGSLVFPVLQETIDVNMNTMRLEVRRADKQSLITQDRMRIDVAAEFYVRVAPDEASIAKAAQTLGEKTLYPDQIMELIEGKLVASLRSVAAGMDMEQLHEKRQDFVQQVLANVREDLESNGLELETISLTGLDQTSVEFFNADNQFDAHGLTKLTETIEQKKKQRNDITQDNDLAIKAKNLATEKQRLDIQRDEEYAKLEQERVLSIRRAEQVAEVSKQEAARRQEAEEARISADRAIKLQSINAEKEIERQEILKKQELEQAEIEQQKALQIAEQERSIAVAIKSEEESQANAKANNARVDAVKAEEQVETTREVEIANRAKEIEIIKAEQQAEKDAVGIKVQAEAEKAAAENRAAARLIEAEAGKKAAILLAEGQAQTYAVDAEGQGKLNTSRNLLSAEQIAMEIRIATVKALPAIIQASAAPMEKIDSIKILQLNNGSMVGGPAANASIAGGSGSLSDQVVDSALRYRSQAPLVDSLLKELGIDGSSLSGMTSSLTQNADVLTESTVIGQKPEDNAINLAPTNVPTDTDVSPVPVDVESLKSENLHTA